MDAVAGSDPQPAKSPKREQLKMPAKDIYHEVVKQSLIKAGWIITHDPYKLRWGKRDLYIDLGAEILAAERADQKIAVEVKSFVGLSEVNELEKALGQYILYHDILVKRDPDRQLYLAIRQDTYEEIFSEPIGTLLLENQRLRLLIFDPVSEVILTWIP